MRQDARPADVVRAVAKLIGATFTLGQWRELGLITDTAERIERHPRLLRSLQWGDGDYAGHVLEITPVLLGEQHASAADAGIDERFANLSAVEDFVGLEAWLSAHEPALHAALYAGSVGLEELQQASSVLRLTDVEEQAARIRRAQHEDPAQAVGSSKELLETVLKGILGLHGTGPETKLEIPQLVKRANMQLGLDASGVRGDEPGASHRRKVLGSLSQIVNSVGELRNAGLGTGHGVSQRPSLDGASARMVVSAAVTVATFYLEAQAADGSKDGPAAGTDEVPW